MYTTASGVQIPQGTDSFSPTTQFKNWADKAATYENRVVVATDSERNALAAPVRRDGLECYVIATKLLWLYDSGWHRIGGVTNQQLDTTNSTGFLTTQYGMGRIVGAATASLTKAVTLPVAFATIPFIQAGYVGARTSGAWNPAGLVDVAVQVVGKGVSPSATGLTVVMHRTDGVNMVAGWDHYFSWSATGVLA